MVTTSLVPWVILQLLVRLTDTGSIGGIEAGKKRDEWNFKRPEYFEFEVCTWYPCGQVYP